MITTAVRGRLRLTIATKVEIIEETIESGWDYIKINVEYDYPVELEAVTLYLSEKEDLSGAKTYSCKIEGKTFSVEIKDLKEGIHSSLIDMVKLPFPKFVETYFAQYPKAKKYLRQRLEDSLEIYKKYLIVD